MDAQRSMLKRSGLVPAKQCWVSWIPPRPGFVKINTDGARKAANGLASAGGLIRNHRGDWIIGFTTNIGCTSSFMAELWGLREGLIVARNHDFNNIVAETDSEAVAQTLNKEEDHSLNTLIADCRDLLGHFQNAEVTHVYREGNQCADYLANLAQSAHWGTSLLDSPPDGILNLLHRDSQGVTTSRFH